MAGFHRGALDASDLWSDLSVATPHSDRMLPLRSEGTTRGQRLFETVLHQVQESERRRGPRPGTASTAEMRSSAAGSGWASSDPGDGITKVEGVLSALHTQTQRDADAFARMREELRVVYLELAARDRELNAATTSHARQMEQWVEDRKRAAELGEHLSSLQEQVRSRDRTLQAATAQLAEATSRLESARAAETRMAAESAAREEKLREARERAERERARADAEVRKTETVEGLLRELYATVRSLQTRDEEHRRELAAAEARAAAAERDLTEARENIKATQTLADERLRALESMRSQVAADREQRGSLEAAVREARSSAARHEEMLAKTEAAAKRCEADNSELRAAVAALRQEVEALEKELSFSTERDRRKDQLVELQQSRQERHDVELASARKALEQAQHDAALLSVQLQSTRDRAARLEVELSIATKANVEDPQIIARLREQVAQLLAAETASNDMAAAPEHVDERLQRMRAAVQLRVTSPQTHSLPAHTAPTPFASHARTHAVAHPTATPAPPMQTFGPALGMTPGQTQLSSLVQTGAFARPAARAPSPALNSSPPSTTTATTATATHTSLPPMTSRSMPRAPSPAVHTASRAAGSSMMYQQQHTINTAAASYFAPAATPAPPPSVTHAQHTMQPHNGMATPAPAPAPAPGTTISTDAWSPPPLHRSPGTMTSTPRPRAPSREERQAHMAQNDAAGSGLRENGSPERTLDPLSARLHQLLVESRRMLNDSTAKAD